MCSGASSTRPASSRSTASSTTTGSLKRPPPCTMRCPTAPTSSGTASSEPTASASSASSTTESFRLVDPALTTRTRLNGSAAPRPVGDRRVVLAVLTRVGARAQAAVLHLLAQSTCPRRDAGHAVDHVHDEVEPIHVVEHDHVERRRRRALLLVAADVQV